MYTLVRSRRSDITRCCDVSYIQRIAMNTYRPCDTFVTMSLIWEHIEPVLSKNEG
jgi:hypothetical protein